MDIGTVIKVIEAVTPCFQALLWPLVLIFILLFLRVPLKRFLANMSEFTLKASTSGIEASAKHIEVAASLGAAAALASKQNDTQTSTEENSRQIVRFVNEATTPEASRRLLGASVLWVDDRPRNQAYERKALAALGIQCTLSASTEDALEKLEKKKYDVIISDMDRPPDPHAGYTLLEQLPELNRTTPFIIYSGHGSLQKYKAEARKKGAYGSTEYVQELFEMVVNTIEGRSEREYKETK